MPLGLGRCCQLGDGLLSGIGVVETGHEGEIAVDGRWHDLTQIAQRVDIVAERGEFADVLAVALFHVTVVFAEGDIVGGARDAGDTGERIVALDTGRSHVMADAGALAAGGEVVADLALVGVGELAPEEGGDMLGLDGVHGPTVRTLAS